MRKCVNVMGKNMEIMGKCTYIMGKYMDIMGKCTNVMGKYIDIMRKCMGVMGRFLIFLSQIMLNEKCYQVLCLFCLKPKLHKIGLHRSHLAPALEMLT
jgi:hypothetical protein